MHLSFLPKVRSAGSTWNSWKEVGQSRQSEKQPRQEVGGETPEHKERQETHQPLWLILMTPGFCAGWGRVTEHIMAAGLVTWPRTCVFLLRCNSLLVTMGANQSHERKEREEEEEEEEAPADSSGSAAQSKLWLNIKGPLPPPPTSTCLLLPVSLHWTLLLHTCAPLTALVTVGCINQQFK